MTLVRPVKTVAALLALLAALTIPPVPAGASPAPTASSARTSARTVSSAGRVFWANAGVEHLRRHGGPARRARVVASIMRDVDATIGLLAETTAAQVRALRRVSGGRFGVVPGRRRGETNAVVYDTTAYRLERTVRVRSFTYHGRRVPVAVAVLRDRSTGTRIAALAVHHPAGNTHRGGQGRWQRRAWHQELGALARIRAAYAGRVSTFLGGDFNEQRTCRHVARTGMVSPLGTVSSCPTARTRIDQLFADPTVAFTGYRAIRRGPARRVTDHAAVYVASFRLRQPA